MKRTLLVDTNRAAYPIYQALRNLGHDVWVIGGNPLETLAKLATNYVQLDYSNFDKVEEFIAKNHFDYLVPGCTDLSYHICAEVNQGRFPGIESSHITKSINTKNSFREIANEINLPVPEVFDPQDSHFKDSIIVKPVDSFSGKGIKILNNVNKTDLKLAYEEAQKFSRSGKVIVEEFVVGQLYSHSAFIKKSNVVVDFLVQEDCVANPFAVDTSQVTWDFPQEILVSLRDDINRFATYLQLLDGLIHTQFIFDGNQYWIIEMTRRCPGDIYSLLIEFATGYPYAASYVAPFVDQSLAPSTAVTLKERIIRHTATSSQGKAFWGFSFSHPVDIKLYVPLATSGDFLKPSPDGRAGIFFFRTSSDQDQKTLYQKLLDTDLYTFH